MKLFRNTGKYWLFLVFVSMVIMVIAYKSMYNGVAVNMLYVYQLAIRDVILLGFIIPIISLLTLKEVNNSMVSSRLIALGSRKLWWKLLIIKIVKNCLASVGIIILPVFFMSNIFMGKVGTLVEWIYVFFVFLTYLIYFNLLTLCMAIIEIKFHQSVFTVCFVLILSYIPNIISFSFRQLEIPNISRFLNLGYAINENGFDWFCCEKVCIVLFIVLIILNKVGSILLQKHDLYWKI